MDNPRKDKLDTDCEVRVTRYYNNAGNTNRLARQTTPVLNVRPHSTDRMKLLELLDFYILFFLSERITCLWNGLLDIDINSFSNLKRFGR